MPSVSHIISDGRRLAPSSAVCRDVQSTHVSGDSCHVPLITTSQQSLVEDCRIAGVCLKSHITPKPETDSGMIEMIATLY